MIPTYTPPAHLNTQALPSQRASILVVDDQVTNIQLLHAILGDDYDISVATNGRDAILLALESPPDLILLDIQMPGLSGFDVCHQLKDSPITRHTPIIFVTAHTNAEDETRALHGGAVDFIGKPFNPDVVKARVRTHVLLKFQSDLLRNMAFIDPLTGLANRRRFEETLRNEWRRCRRSGTPLAVLMIDVDHFKQYNDHYGHQLGDACLQLVGRTLAQQLNRSHDLAARYGGEEFICLMPECDLQGALSKAENLRHAIQALGIEHAASKTAPFVTTSLGAHALIPDQGNDHEHLITIADQQLYTAKSQGRNRCAPDITTVA